MPNAKEYQPVSTIEREISPAPRQTLRLPRLHQAGYWSLVGLILVLPFELTERPFFNSPLLVLNDLKVLLYLTAGLALLSLIEPLWAFVSGLLQRQPDRKNFFYRQRLPLALLLALGIAAVVSSLLAGEFRLTGEGLKWTFELGVGGLIWLGIGLWLPGRAERDLNRLGLALVAGGVISGLVGFGEFVFGMDFAQSLVGWFKTKPTVAGPYLRLSGTFEYANIAAMYYELALPLALVGLGQAVAQPKRVWPVILGWVGAAAILIEALILTLSRGAWLGLAVGLAAMLVVTHQRYGRAGSRGQWWRVLGGAIGGTVGLALLTFAMIPQVGLRLASQSDQDWYKAVYTSRPPTSLTVCQELTVPVTVENRGPLTWQASSTQPYNLSYHWLNPGGGIAVFEGMRTSLTANLSPGSTLTVQATLRGPTQPGQYWLVWDMVQEEISWFSLKSPDDNRWPVEVTDLAADQKNSVCGIASSSTAPRRDAPKQLPKVLDQPNRSDLWKAALKMVQSRPLMGVGPNSFRLHYGSFATPPLTEWDKNIFANSLPLEILADLGLVGGGLFAAFFLAAVWPLFKAGLGRAGPGAAWEIAVIGALVAFLGHGLLDYILGSHAINTLFWILLGLAAVVHPPDKTRHDYNKPLDHLDHKETT